jgi:hypothetical protein
MFKRQHNLRICRVFLIWTILWLAWSGNGFAAGLFSSDDAEKPKPEFSRQGEWITAKFIPRAKSTSVQVGFGVTGGGELETVKGVDFGTVDRPEVDIKNFKSSAFEVDVRNVAKGETATVALRSDFFTSSTAFYVFNPKRDKPWIENAQAENRALPQRVRELIVPVRDGGDLDADGSANGRITLIGGPRDSFWGYALGTLFIRFFGIFIVLTMLMIGMMASGVVFKTLERKKAVEPTLPDSRFEKETSVPPAAASAKESVDLGEQITEPGVAAIAAALYLRDKASKSGKSCGMPAAEPGTAWSLEGRRQIMRDRLMVFQNTRRAKG